MVKYLRSPEVQEISGLSPVTIWRLEKRGEFPRRRQIGPNAVGWRSDEIEAWVEGRPVADAESTETAGAA